jgi:hypothetical protein
MRADQPTRRPIVVGEVCPTGASGRPAVAALVARRERSWIADPQKIRELLEHGQIGRLSVLSFEGRRTGIFTAMGPVDLGTRWPAALGGLAGASPCATEKTQPECLASQRDCGLAVGVIGADLGDDSALDVATGTACVDGGRLVVDIDGDGVPEVFALDAFTARGKHGLADEVVGAPGKKPAEGAEPCAARFAHGNIAHGLDLIGVADLDGDGRRELIVQLREGDRRTWGIYSPSQSAVRLELVAAVLPWAHVR